jgi:hypothetical protein
MPKDFDVKKFYDTKTMQNLISKMESSIFMRVCATLRVDKAEDGSL